MFQYILNILRLTMNYNTNKPKQNIISYHKHNFHFTYFT